MEGGMKKIRSQRSRIFCPVSEKVHRAHSQLSSARRDTSAKLYITFDWNISTEWTDYMRRVSLDLPMKAILAFF